jgi:hypothetical protein
MTPKEITIFGHCCQYVRYFHLLKRYSIKGGFGCSSDCFTISLNYVTEFFCLFQELCAVILTFNDIPVYRRSTQNKSSPFYITSKLYPTRLNMRVIIVDI